MFWKYFTQKSGYNTKMKAMNKKIELLENQVLELQDAVKKLQENLGQVGGLIQYLSTTQMELSTDMSKIYRSLQVVVKAVGAPKGVMNFPVLGADDDDDDLLN
jgi:exonuclease VII small subunit